MYFTKEVGVHIIIKGKKKMGFLKKQKGKVAEGRKTQNNSVLINIK